MLSKLQRGYNVEEFGCWRISVVACSAKEAKKVAVEWAKKFCVYQNWLNVRVKWVRGADIQGLSTSIVDDEGEAYSRHFINYIEG
jgi:hypothetical protein